MNSGEPRDKQYATSLIGECMHLIKLSLKIDVSSARRSTVFPGNSNSNPQPLPLMFGVSLECRRSLSFTASIVWKMASSKPVVICLHYNCQFESVFG